MSTENSNEFDKEETEAKCEFEEEQFGKCEVANKTSDKYEVDKGTSGKCEIDDEKNGRKIADKKKSGGVEKSIKKKAIFLFLLGIVAFVCIMIALFSSGGSKENQYIGGRGYVEPEVVGNDFEDSSNVNSDFDEENGDMIPGHILNWIQHRIK